MRLKATFTPSFARDLKRIRKRGFNEHDLLNVIDLIIENTADSREELRRRHRMHSLKGAWKGSSEYHVANAGDWLVVWREHDGVAFFKESERTTRYFDSKRIVGMWFSIALGMEAE